MPAQNHHRDSCDVVNFVFTDSRLIHYLQNDTLSMNRSEDLRYKDSSGHKQEVSECSREQ